MTITPQSTVPAIKDVSLTGGKIQKMMVMGNNQPKCNRYPSRIARGILLLLAARRVIRAINAGTTPNSENSQLIMIDINRTIVQQIQLTQTILRVSKIQNGRPRNGLAPKSVGIPQR
jgi:hypothetical protein